MTTIRDRLVMTQLGTRQAGLITPSRFSLSSVLVWSSCVFMSYRSHFQYGIGVRRGVMERLPDHHAFSHEFRIGLNGTNVPSRPVYIDGDNFSHLPGVHHYDTVCQQ